MYAWLFQPNYNEQVATSYINRNSNITYDIPIQQFLPSYTMLTFCAADEPGCNENGYSGNDPDLWKFEVYQTFADGERVSIESVLCTDLVASWPELDEGQR